MNAKVIIAAVIVAGGAIAVASVARHRTPARPEVSAVQPEPSPAAVETPAVVPEPAAETSRTSTPQVVTAPPVPASATTVPATPAPPKTPAVEPKASAAIPKPLAAASPSHPAVPFGRAALRLVGMDEEAELVWGLTINDPTVPAEARKDLIEDLNEDGFPDPKHLTADDVPLIVNRMALIEQMAPDSMDETNAAAFTEAYKDLINMLAKAAR